MLVAFLIVLALLAALSARSIFALRGTPPSPGLGAPGPSPGRRESPATAAGWLFTLAYAVLAAARAIRPASVAPVVEYAPLVLLTIAFVTAGRRDEPQAEPWWWPARPGKTGAERRR